MTRGEAIRRLRIGIGRQDYNAKRTSYGLPVPGATFHRAFRAPLNRIHTGWQAQNTYWFLDPRRYDLLHTFNGIVFNKRPFVVSFEARLPSTPRDLKSWLYPQALERLYSDDCKKLLAFSEFSKRMLIAEHGPEFERELGHKIQVFRGGIDVKELPGKEKAINSDRPLHCCFIGHDFFRKGGVPILRAFGRMSKEKLPVKLTVVSKLNFDDYVTGEDEAAMERAKQILTSSSWVNWLPQLPQSEVYSLMRDCDLSLLPTLDDTYGWSVVESMHFGLPVIATNACAIPEIISDGENGLLIPVDRISTGRWIGMGAPKKSADRRGLLDEVYEKIEAGIHSAIESVLNDRSRLQYLSANAKLAANAQHNTLTQANKLRGIYDKVIEGT